MLRGIVLLLSGFTISVSAAQGQELVDAAPSGNSLLCECLAMVDMTDEKREACNSYVDGADPDVLRTEAASCDRDLLTATEVDVCYCLSANPTDEDVISACEELVPPTLTRQERYDLAQTCDPADDEGDDE
ncbi:MAG: hypothetical protein AAFR91_00320 [Pseudomonadota bacterium]